MSKPTKKYTIRVSVPAEVYHRHELARTLIGKDLADLAGEIWMLGLQTMLSMRLDADNLDSSTE